MSQEAMDALKAASTGLLYTSESDEPFEVVSLNSAETAFAPLPLSKLLGNRQVAPIKEVDLEAFFADLIKEEDWHGETEKALVNKYKNLLQAIRTHLRLVKVVKVGQIEIDIYIIGQMQEGFWAALKTKAIET